MARRSEQGNILGFVLVGALLLGLLAGGMYVIKSYSPSSDEVAQTTSKDDKKNVAKDEKKSSSETKSDDKLKATLDAQSSATKEKSTDTKDTKKAEDTSKKESTTADKVSELPETGMGDAVAPLIGATLLVGTTVSYARSRRLI